MSVVAAGNCGDKPYCIGDPAAEPTAFAVAQTSMPRSYIPLTVDSTEYQTEHFTWSKKLTKPVAGKLQFGTGQNTNLDGCQPFIADSLKRKIILVERGTCTFTSKILNIQKAGGLVAVISNNIKGPIFSGDIAGSEYPTIPAFMISYDDGEKVQISAYGDTWASFDPLNRNDVGFETILTSARGPDGSYNAIKPDIAAPGESVSALARTGDKSQAFGGTSGAAPVVAGAAAVLKQKCHTCSALKIKSLLMNNADRNIISDTTGDTAEVTRVGAGVVRVDKALNAMFWAYSPDDNQPSLSLGLVDAAEDTSISRTVRIKNLSNEEQKLRINYEFRSNDAKNSAIHIEIKEGLNLTNQMTLNKKEVIDVQVIFHIKAALLPTNHMNSGKFGGDPKALSKNEIDGYLII